MIVVKPAFAKDVCEQLQRQIVLWLSLITMKSKFMHFTYSQGAPPLCCLFQSHRLRTQGLLEHDCNGYKL